MKISKMICLFLFLGFLNPFLHNNVHSEIKKENSSINHNIYIDFMSSVNSKIEKNSFEKDVLERNIFDGVSFSAEDLKLEMIGNTEKISYCFSQRLFHKNKKMDPEEEEENDDTSSRVDSIIHLAYLKYKWNEKLSFLIGKQPVSFGSMEYHFVPISKHQYSEVLYKNKNKDNNPIGINFIYTPIKNHEFKFQIVNSVSKNQLSEKPISLKQVRSPMGYSFNWNGSFFKKRIQNRWSYSIFQENHKEKFWKLLALGSKFYLNPVSIEINYILSDEDIERNGYLTKTFHSLIKNYSHNSIKKVSPVTYRTYLVKLNYNFIPRWNLFAKGVYDIGRSKEGGYETHWMLKNQLFKKAYTCYGGIEYKYPINNHDNISLYLLYTREKVVYLDHIQKENKNDHSISLGLNYRIKLL
ncbi:porin [Blattabacterium cuenoti]|uniref:porin n=1 Tax=Blattabacterium cuenoti TaxID=1653831 RepID=UPI00163C8B89|nr:porin [Blattabacterium cuenoti]